MRTLAFALVVALLAVGCATTRALAPRLVPLNEPEFAPYANSGTASIVGAAFLTTWGGEVKHGAGVYVYLVPVTSYTTEWWQREVLASERLVEPDPRLNNYQRTTTADGEGRFRFENLPAGDYYVVSRLVVGYRAGETSPFATGTSACVLAEQVTVGAGQRISVILDTAVSIRPSPGLSRSAASREKPIPDVAPPRAPPPEKPPPHALLHGVRPARSSVLGHDLARGVDALTDGRADDPSLPDAWVKKLKLFWAYKGSRRESREPDGPLLCSQSRWRISKRRVQVAFRAWQARAGLDRHCGFHALRHTSVTSAYRLSRDLFIAQRFARHASPPTTVCLAHPGDDDLRAAVRRLSC